jgi:hypothetical protein
VTIGEHTARPIELPLKQAYLLVIIPNTNMERFYAWEGRKQEILLLFEKQKHLKEKLNKITTLSLD